MRWISVRDSLPEQLANVLVHIKNDATDGSVSEVVFLMGEFIDRVELQINRLDARACVGVTHWMPLPEPPE